jgi:Flp pilus assembly pilin Flp
MQPRDPTKTSRSNRLAMLSIDERGASAIEYALLSALIALAIVASIGGVGSANADTFNNVTDSIGHAGNGHGKGGGNSGNGQGNGGPAGP